MLMLKQTQVTNLQLILMISTAIEESITHLLVIKISIILNIGPAGTTVNAF
jgi:hypothetical protein